MHLADASLAVVAILFMAWFAMTWLSTATESTAGLVRRFSAQSSLITCSDELLNEKLAFYDPASRGLAQNVLVNRTVPAHCNYSLTDRPAQGFSRPVFLEGGGVAFLNVW